MIQTHTPADDTGTLFNRQWTTVRNKRPTTAIRVATVSLSQSGAGGNATVHSLHMLVPCHGHFCARHQMEQNITSALEVFF